jgi:4-hydroxybenzoate polyprenyltransferase
MIVFGVSVFVMWTYSAPPVRLKSRPGLDLLTHALFVQTWPYLICLWLTGATWTHLDGILLSICFLTSLGGQLNQQVRDFAVDTLTDTNFATRVGLANAILVLRSVTLAMVILCLLAVSAGSIPWLFIPLGLLGLPKIVQQMLQRLNDPSPILPRRFVYVTMMLALIYTGLLMVLEGVLGFPGG